MALWCSHSSGLEPIQATQLKRANVVRAGKHGGSASRGNQCEFMHASLQEATDACIAHPLCGGVERVRFTSKALRCDERAVKMWYELRSGDVRSRPRPAAAWILHRDPQQVDGRAASLHNPPGMRATNLSVIRLEQTAHSGIRTMPRAQGDSEVTAPYPDATLSTCGPKPVDVPSHMMTPREQWLLRHASLSNANENEWHLHSSGNEGAGGDGGGDGASGGGGVSASTGDGDMHRANSGSIGSRYFSPTVPLQSPRVALLVSGTLRGFRRCSSTLGAAFLNPAWPAPSRTPSLSPSLTPSSAHSPTHRSVASASAATYLLSVATYDLTDCGGSPPFDASLGKAQPVQYDDVAAVYRRLYHEALKEIHATSRRRDGIGTQSDRSGAHNDETSPRVGKTGTHGDELDIRSDEADTRRDETGAGSVETGAHADESVQHDDQHVAVRIERASRIETLRTSYLSRRNISGSRLSPIFGTIHPMAVIRFHSQSFLRHVAWSDARVRSANVVVLLRPDACMHARFSFHFDFVSMRSARDVVELDHTMSGQRAGKQNVKERRFATSQQALRRRLSQRSKNVHSALGERERSKASTQLQNTKRAGAGADDTAPLSIGALSAARVSSTAEARGGAGARRSADNGASRAATGDGTGDGVAQAADRTFRAAAGGGFREGAGADAAFTNPGVDHNRVLVVNVLLRDGTACEVRLGPNELLLPRSDLHEGEWDDTMAIGQPESMSRYISLYLRLSGGAYDNTSQIPGLLVPEQLLRHHLERFEKVKIVDACGAARGDLMQLNKSC